MPVFDTAFDGKVHKVCPMSSKLGTPNLQMRIRNKVDSHGNLLKVIMSCQHNSKYCHYLSAPHHLETNQLTG